jgi:rubrerythrin
MHAMTASNLRSAYAGESMAHMRYLIWGEQAEKNGFPNVGRMFAAIAFAEQCHATNHFRALKDEAGAFDVTGGGVFGLKDTSQALQGGIDGETFEIEEMYPAYLEIATFQGEKQAQTSFHYALEAEKIHAVWYAKAKQAVDAGHDIDLGPVRICEVCGHTIEGDAPDFCPICGAKAEAFVAFA